MDYYNISTEIVSGKKIFKIQIEDDSLVDYIALKTLINDCPPYLLPFRHYKINNKLVIEYDNCDNLDIQYLPNDITKNEYLSVFSSLVLAFKNCEDYFLNQDSLIMKPKYIVYDKFNYSLKFIYLPIKNLKNDYIFIDFIKYLLKNVNVNKAADIQLGLLQETLEPAFNIMLLEKFLLSYKQPSCLNPSINIEEAPKEIYKDQQLVSSDTAVKSIDKKLDINYKGKIDEEFDCNTIKEKDIYQLLKSNKTQSKKNKNSIIKLIKNSLTKKKVDNRNTINKNDDHSVESRENFLVAHDPLYSEYSSQVKTEILDCNIDRYFVLRLVINNTATKIPQVINIYNTLEIGRGGNNSSINKFYFGQGITHISRRHARFDVMNNTIKIIDLNSSNGTFVNGERLVANIPNELRLGDMIKFSNYITYTLDKG